VIVRPEEGAELIMNSTIRQDFDTYSRQQDTLIVWSEPDGTDLALSFQEVSGCNDIWILLMEAQKRLRAEKSDIDQLPLSTDGILCFVSVCLQ
jgi:protein phosphatase-4 regulatory subunit 3